MRKHVIAIGVALILTACTATSEATSTTTTALGNVTAPVDSIGASEPQLAEPGTSSQTTATVNDNPIADGDEVATIEPAPGQSPGLSGGGIVDIETQPLAAVVAGAIRSGGGELATTEDWTSRYPTLGLPVLDGSAVHLVEASLTATQTSNGWERVDEMQWLFNSSSMSRDEILGELGVAAGVTDWDVNEESSVIDAAECVQRTYTSSTSTTFWTLQGCQYPTYSGMAAIGISRTSSVDATGAPTMVDPSVAGVVDVIDATIETVTVTFGAPASSESTATLVTQTELITAATSPAEVLGTTALAGWTRTDEEAGAVLFAGAPGAHWVVVNASVRFTSEGRLAP